MFIRGTGQPILIILTLRCNQLQDSIFGTAPNKSFNMSITGGTKIHLLHRWKLLSDGIVGDKSSFYRYTQELI